MSRNRKCQAVYYHTTDKGADLEFTLDAELCYYPQEGDGWNEPRIPAHWEIDCFDVVDVTVYHREGHREFETPKGSLLYKTLMRYLDHQDTVDGSVTNACEEAANDYLIDHA